MHRALLLIACVLVVAACKDSPARTLVQRSSAAISMSFNGIGPADYAAPECPEPGESPDPFPPDLPPSPTVAAGTIAGSFSVTSTGEAVYSMPLVVPPGRAGVQPSLAVTYDSAATGEGYLGSGFSISGLSAIARCPHNIAQDGEIRGVRDDTADALCLDGKRLVSPVVIIDGPPDFLPEYRTFPDTFVKVVSNFAEQEGWDRSKGAKSFTVYTKSGQIVHYGASASSRVIAKDGNIASWLISSVRDRNGNAMSFSYYNDKHPDEGYTVEQAPRRINYTAHPNILATRAVEFEYSTREEAGVRILYSRGMALRRSLRLDRIKMLGPGDSLVRDYRFSYGTGPVTGRMLLEEIEECAADHTCKPPTRFAWRHDGFLGFAEAEAPVSDPESAKASVMLLDVTGDGLDDLVVPDVDMTGGSENPITSWFIAPNLGPEQSSAYFDNATLAYQQTHYQPPSPIQPELGTPLDYNHDGLMDVLLHDVHGQFMTWHVLLAKPDPGFDLLDTGVFRVFPIAVPPPAGLKDPNAAAHLADVDGDGIADMIQCAFNGSYFNWFLNPWKPETNGFDPAGTPIQELDLYPCDRPFHTVDINSDGKVDLIVLKLHVNNGGATFGPTYEALSYRGFGLWERPPAELKAATEAGRIIFLDVNGDGLPDAVETGGAGEQLRTHINTGAGFSDPVDSISELLIDENEFAKLAAPIDWNVDGRQDLLIPMKYSGNVPEWVILQSTGSVGDGTFSIVSPGIPFEAQFLQDEDVTLADPHGPRVTDLDGDGTQDVVLAVGGSFRVYKNTLTEQDLLADVIDGMNALEPTDPGYLPNVQISYGHLIDLARTAGVPADSAEAESRTYLPRYESSDEECAYPVRCVVGARRVVSGYVLNNGADHPRHFQVAYRNGRYHRLGRGFLGFGARIVRDLDTGAGTAEFYDNVTYSPDLETFPYAGQVARSWRWNPSLSHDAGPGEGPIELSYTHSVFQIVETLSSRNYFTLPVVRRETREQGTFIPGGALTVEQYVRETESNAATILGDSFTVLDDYDEYGNIGTELTWTAGVDLEQTVTRQFSNDENEWLIGLVASQTECSSALPGKQCRTTTRTYDDRGQVETEVASSDDDDPETLVSLTFVRDEFGNITFTSAEDAFGKTRASCMSYDAEHIFPYAQGNPAAHLTFTKFDRGLGVRTAAVDPNGLVTRWRHDGFGRITRELRPDGTETSYTLTRTKDAGPLQNEWNVKLRTMTPALQDDTVQFDSRGSPIRWWTQGVQAGGQPAERIMRHIVFDESGEHVAWRSVPTGEQTPPLLIRYDRWEYDGMGRVVEHTTPWGAVTTTRYIGSRVIIAGPGGAGTLIENDALGRPVTITRTDEGGPVSYTYGPFGGLWTATDPGGATTTTVRDAYGRVREHIDPDRGTTTAHYDGFGQRTSSVDAQGREIEVHYDPLGRMFARVDDDGTTFWRWDKASHGIGELAEVESPDGHRTTYSYDLFGRPAGSTLTIDGESFASSVTYDPFGRVRTITYPEDAGVAPFVVRQEYDAYGHLVAVRDDGTLSPYWELVSTDSAARILTESFGNGVITTRSYFQDKQRVATIHTTSGGTTLQNLSYNYDHRLNLSRRTDVPQAKSEYFEYDRIDRLKCADFDVLPECSHPYEYDDSGNILSKPGIGSYTYDPVQPHAVRTAGLDTFEYDATGNQITRPGATIQYTAFDLPKAFTLGQGGSVELDYDGNQQRVRKTTANKVTVYVGDLYERVTDTETGLVEHRYHVRSSERVVAIVTQSPSAPAASRYVHADNLGSVDVLTNEAGGEVERHSYDAFGGRRNPDWGAPPPAAFPSEATLGFTGHEADDELGLVNMKGRIYDPKIGRFLTPDPIVSMPQFGQSWNPYSYVLNSPLAYVDPSGFSSVTASEAEEDRDSGANGASREGGGDIEVYVVGPPRGRKVEGPREARDAGATAAPVDVEVYGNTSGDAPQPDPATTAPSLLGMVKDLWIGSLLGVGQVAVGMAKFAVLNTLTSGRFGVQETARAVLVGYQESGLRGALNAVNPLHQIVKGAEDAVLAMQRGDHRAAGAAGMTTAIIVASTVVSVAGGVKAPTGAPSGAGTTTVAGPPTAAPTIAEGSFSIVDWAGYPTGVPRPAGPFRIIAGEEYTAARAAANAENAQIIQQHGPFGSMEIHEIHPIKFGGEPVAHSNKMLIPKLQHWDVSKWWAQMEAYATRGPK